jgi:hypothetical protein
MPQSDRVKRVVQQVSGWPGITVAPHRFGGMEFRFGRGEIGHVHPSGLVDVPFPRPVRDQLVKSGRARAHHVLPESGWVSFAIQSDESVAEALELLRLSYDLRTGRETEKRGGAGDAPAAPGDAPTSGRSTPLEDRLDEALEESFPASDPPAVHRRSGGDAA